MDLIAEDGGPIKLRPDFSTISANLKFSLRNPYPG